MKELSIGRIFEKNVHETNKTPATLVSLVPKVKGMFANGVVARAGSFQGLTLFNC